MGGFTSAVHWWEESQLRVLVLGSAAVQVLLFIFSSLRRLAIPGWVRSITWLAYLAGDAVAVYALATLFNRHDKDQGSGGGNNNISSTLEVMWAPVLLLHLGGHDGITAYNIEDNELWGRHLITAVSQVTVAIYVFCKSWPPDGDKRLLAAAVLLFIPGVAKCFMKPWALQSASIYSLVRSSRAATARQNNQDEEEYVKGAKKFVDDQDPDGNENVLDELELVATHAAASVKDDGFCARCRASLRTMKTMFSIREVRRLRQRRRKSLQQLGMLVDDKRTWPWPPSGEEDKDHSLSQGQSCFCAQFYRQHKQLSNEIVEVKKREEVLGEASDKLFVDLSSPNLLRLRILKYFWGISQDTAYGHAQGGLAAAFFLLYTKLKTAGLMTRTERFSEKRFCDRVLIIGRWLIRLSRVVLPLVSISLFHRSRHSEEAGNDDTIDVKITYVIFYCTAVLEIFSALPIAVGEVVARASRSGGSFGKSWPEMVAQYSLIEYTASNMKRKSKWMQIAATKFGCNKGMEPCFSSATISKLVLGYLKQGWKKEIHDVRSYRRFNDHSTHWPRLLVDLERNQWQCSSSSNGCLGLSSSSSSKRKRKRAFDESVLLWHMATDFCFFSGSSFAEHTTGCVFAEVPSWKARLSAPVSILLLGLPDFIHATKKRIREMAGKWTTNSSPVHNNRTTGSRCGQEFTHCKAVLCTQMSNYMAHLLFVNPEMLLPGSRRNLFTTAHQELMAIFKNHGDKPPLGLEKRELAPKIISKLLQSSSQTGGSGTPETFIHEAWTLARKLQSLGDEKKMWDVIHGVWVERLCYSASRCRGYLHAKALGEGGEFLSYVWLLLFYMGMETFTDKLQREEPAPSQEFEAGNNNPTAPPSTPNVSTTGTTAPSTSEICIIDVFTTDADTTPSTSEICMAEDDTVNVSTTDTTAPSTSEICIIDYVFTADTGAAPSTS